MENYYYSPTENIFFPISIRALYEQTDSWPLDCAPVSDEIFREFTDVPKGKARVAGDDGMPMLIDIPLIKSQ